jgi:hypothetical protein
VRKGVICAQRCGQGIGLYLSVGRGTDKDLGITCRPKNGV